MPWRRCPGPLLPSWAGRPPDRRMPGGIREAALLRAGAAPHTATMQAGTGLPFRGMGNRHGCPEQGGNRIILYQYIWQGLLCLPPHPQGTLPCGRSALP